MAVTVHNVRDALNDISEDELADETIQQKIQDAEEDATDLGYPDNERYIRDLAAYKAFLVSRSYVSAKVGDITVRRDLEAYVDALWQNVQTDLEVGGYEKIQVAATPMFDDRPEDPYEKSISDD